MHHVTDSLALTCEWCGRPSHRGRLGCHGRDIAGRRVGSAPTRRACWVQSGRRRARPPGSTTRRCNALRVGGQVAAAIAGATGGACHSRVDESDYAARL